MINIGDGQAIIFNSDQNSGQCMINLKINLIDFQLIVLFLVIQIPQNLLQNSQLIQNQNTVQPQQQQPQTITLQNGLQNGLQNLYMVCNILKKKNLFFLDTFFH